MTIRKADVDDIDLLIKLRLDFLSEEKGPMSQEDQDALQPSLAAYFTKWISSGAFVAFIAEEDEQVLSTAFLSIAERPPRQAFPSRLVGTVYNVYTYAGFRRRGIATKVMSALLEEAKALSLVSVDLLATADGQPLYEKLGFRETEYTAMRIRKEELAARRPQ